MQFKFSLQPIISILYIFLGIILPPCFCCTGEYKSLFKFLVFFLSDVVSSKPWHELHMLPADQSKWSLSRQPALSNSKCLLLWKRRYKKSQISKRPHHMHINGSKWWIKTKDSQISQEGDERYENILDIFLNIFFHSLIHSQRLIFSNESLPVTLNFQEMRITF